MSACLFRWFFPLLLILQGPRLLAQLTVYPGDANNNGIVNNIDVLYVGYSFGTPGPSRVFTDTEFEPQDSPAAWAGVFPDGTSFAYADANGDGVVGLQDLLAINRNYGATRPPVVPDEFPEVPEGANRLHLEKGNEPLPLIPGSVFSIPIYLNDTDLPLELNGLAFTLEYDSSLIKNINIQWDANWLNADSSWYALQVPIMGEKAQLEVATTRFGNDPVLGGGLLGRVNIIIEDDLIGLLPAPHDTVNVLIAIKKLRGIGKDFQPIPLLGDDYTFTVHHPDARPNGVRSPEKARFKIYPNPANRRLWIESPKNIESVVLQDLLGRPLRVLTDLAAPSVQLELPDLPPGLYLIRVQTEAGTGCRELLIE